MTSSINQFNFPKKMNLTIINNTSKLSSFEQKNLTILILARYKLAFFVEQNPNDEFINSLYTWLENNVMDFRDIDIAFSAYYNAKEGTQLKKDLFKIVKPLEELAVYLSNIAQMNNNIKNKDIDINDIMLIKAFTLNLLSYWFNRILPIDLKKQTVYFQEVLEFDFESELDKLNNKFSGYGYKNRTDVNEREQINIMYDCSFEIADFIHKYKFKIMSAPIKGARKLSRKK